MKKKKYGFYEQRARNGGSLAINKYGELWSNQKKIKVLKIFKNFKNQGGNAEKNFRPQL